MSEEIKLQNEWIEDKRKEVEEQNNFMRKKIDNNKEVWEKISLYLDEKI